MTMISLQDRAALEVLESRVRAILPEEYQDSYEDVQPISMGSAGLKYGADGKVAWNDIWTTFCDLAMAGGPPHKGMWLEPASQIEIDAHTDEYQAVVDEISRGVTMVTGLAVPPSPSDGWVRVRCLGEGMAGWLLRAIVMENVSARSDGAAILLPAGPGYRVEKEIKNVLTVIAKTCHYWMGHMWRAQQRAIADLFMAMNADSPLVEPALDVHQSVGAQVAASIHHQTGLPASSDRYAGWLGVECPSVRAAVWMMRTMVAVNVLSRREGTLLYVPLNPATDPGGAMVVRSLALIHRLAGAKGLLHG